jgi:hypothetical protein
VTATDPPATAPARTGFSLGRALAWLAAVAALPAATLALCLGLILHVRSKPAFGPPEAAAGEFTVAPGVSVQILPSHRALLRKDILDFDANSQGAVVVRTSAGLYDLAGGRRVGPDPGREGLEITSMAFAGPGLTVITGDGRMGTWDDEGFSPVEMGGARPAAVFSSRDWKRLYVLGDRGWRDNVPWGLCSLAEDQPLRAETGSSAEITAVTADEAGTVFAAGGAIFRLVAPGRPVMLVRLPGDEPVVGLASAGGTIYFATYENTYALGREMAVPVVVGLGGRLRHTPGGLLVLDERREWLFRIVVEKPE